MKRFNSVLAGVFGLGLVIGPCMPTDCPEDINGDGAVDAADLAQLLGAWGPCPVPACGEHDAGSCCVANGTPFCDDATCCDSVCAIDPFCCTNTWDALCADGAAKDPNCNCAPGECSETLTQNSSTDPSTLVDGGGVGCASGVDSLLTFIARSYEVVDFTVCTVESGFENEATVPRCVTINVYSDSDGGDPETGLTLLGTVDGEVPALFLGVLQFTLDTPVIHTGTLVVELVVYDSADALGNTRSGCNAAPESETFDSYIKADDCGIGAYAPWDSVGLTTQFWIQSFNGTADAAAGCTPLPPPAPDHHGQIKLGNHGSSSSLTSSN